MAWLLTADAWQMRAQGEEQDRALARAQQFARDAGNSTLEIESIVRSGPPMVWGPVPVDEGVRRLEEIRKRFEESAAIQRFALHVLAHLWARLGQADEARETMAKWREESRELGQELLYAGTAGCTWDVCSLAEDWAGGERALREADEILEQMQERAWRSAVAANLGEALYRQGLDEAERYAEISRALAASDDYTTQVWWRAVRAKVLASRGELAEAESLAREAVEIAAETDYLDVHAGALLDLAEVLSRQDRGEEARTAVMEALALYELKENVVGASRARKLL